MERRMRRTRWKSRSSSVVMIAFWFTGHAQPSKTIPSTFVMLKSIVRDHACGTHPIQHSEDHRDAPRLSAPGESQGNAGSRPLSPCSFLPLPTFS